MGRPKGSKNSNKTAKKAAKKTTTVVRSRFQVAKANLSTAKKAYEAANKAAERADIKVNKAANNLVKAQARFDELAAKRPSTKATEPFVPFGPSDGEVREAARREFDLTDTGQFDLGGDEATETTASH
jgi:multidrug efflux pump subunit AcrA (membrane-fusion protein)